MLFSRFDIPLTLISVFNIVYFPLKIFLGWDIRCCHHERTMGRPNRKKCWFTSHLWNSVAHCVVLFKTWWSIRHAGVTWPANDENFKKIKWTLSSTLHWCRPNNKQHVRNFFLSLLWTILFLVLIDLWHIISVLEYRLPSGQYFFLGHV